MTAVFDLVVAGGRIVDGCGNPWFRGDVGIRDGLVAAIAHPHSLAGERVLDARDHVVAPGFVDPHTHSDLSLLVHGRAETAVYQGVTTHVIGNCGMSVAPLEPAHREELEHLWDHYGWALPEATWGWGDFAEYLKGLEGAGTAINVVPLVGHAALRVAVMGLDKRPPRASELAMMERLLDESMDAGAHGLSTGLVYPPGCYADTAEIAALCGVVARHGGLYTSHIRGERETILVALAEAIGLGRLTGVPVQVSHNAPKWGAAGGADKNLQLIDEARRDGLDVTVDNDVHTELAVRLSRALPQPLLDLSHADLLALLSDRRGRSALRADIQEERYPGAGYTGLLRHEAYDRILVLDSPGRPELAGRSVLEIATCRGVDPLDAYIDLIVEDDDRIMAIFEYMRPEDIRALACHPAAMFCSDGLVMPPLEGSDSGAPYWPCSYGEHAGILERLVREEGVLRLEEAIRKMTSFPAQRFGLFNRGVLRPGMSADVIVFDLEGVRDRATNPYPHALPFINIPPRSPLGFEYVIVNGRVVAEKGCHTGALPGMVVRHRVRCAGGRSRECIRGG